MQAYTCNYIHAHTQEEKEGTQYWLDAIYSPPNESEISQIHAYICKYIHAHAQEFREDTQSLLDTTNSPSDESEIQ